MAAAFCIIRIAKIRTKSYRFCQKKTRFPRPIKPVDKEIFACYTVFVCENVFLEEVFMKKVTVKDIAKASGFSVSTVSKTLNGTDRISPQTAQKIKHIAAKMGYRSSFAAQSLAHKARRVAIVLFESPQQVRRLFEEGFRIAFDLYKEFGIEPWFLYFDSSCAQGARSIPWEQIRAECDAVILTPSEGLKNHTRMISNIGQKMPLVFLQTLQWLSMDSVHLGDVTVNAYAAGAMAAQFLSFCGCRQTALITGYQTSWIHEENINGYLNTAGHFGISNLAVAESFDDMEKAYCQTDALLKQYPALDGIYVSSYVAPGVCQKVRESGRKITVVGTDLVAGSIDCLTNGSLSAAIFQNQVAQARLASEMVVDVFRRGVPLTERPNSIRVKPELVFSSNLSCYDEKALLL